MNRSKKSSNNKPSPTLRNGTIISNLNHFVKSTLAVILCLILATPVTANSSNSGLPDDATIDAFGKVEAFYYNPSGDACQLPYTASSLSSSGYERLKDAVKAYGEVAMAMQREWGTPWEVVLAQMQKESSVGTAGIAINGAFNNWLGITGKGDAGSWTSPSGRNWAVYSSVEASIHDWAGTRVLRNGYYDTAFSYLDPNNYNLEQFIRTMVSSYAPSSDGNNEEAYASDVLSFISGPIEEVRSSMGWPSSAELAANENISIGGKHPIGSDLSSSPTNTVDPNCVGPGSGNINKTAIALSWPERAQPPRFDPNTAYHMALNAFNGVATRKQGDTCSIRGDSCDAFIASVMRYSGADPGFPCCGAANQLNYLSNSKSYIEIPNIGNPSNLLPGDIRSKGGHIEMYVVLPDGSGRIASASHCERTADHGISYYPDASFRIFRKI